MTADRDFPDVDPEMIEGLRRWNRLHVSPEDLAAFRNRPPVPSDPGLIAPGQLTVPGLAGEPDVKLLTINVEGGADSRAAFLWIHGGGFVGGYPDIPESIHRMAQEHDWLVASVDYRLAPEAPFPAALNDCHAALLWLHDHAQALNIDPHRIAIGGTSAGAGHAATLALAVREHDVAPIAFQLLMYPALDDRTGISRPAAPGTGNHVWTAAANRFGWSSLLGEAAGSRAVRPASVPARMNDLARLPPTFIGVGTLDLFFAEDVAYATRLAASGVPVELEVVPAAFHGFERIAPDAHASRRFNQRWMTALLHALEPGILRENA
ncbi:alpha/beta hydrolase [Pseudoxanthomonas winnipegensis]|uniref:alpha/beta hydrolase n=1 Tax=Pseudoxanthomonas winnipegensis TaxID=2480810 RepID=UPI0030F3F5DF